MSNIQNITLRNGVEVQMLGVGTYKAVPMDTVIHTALDAGYRAIDAAEHYGNEAEVGAAMASSGYSRDALYLSTKIWNTDHGYKKTLEAFEKSRERLGTRIDTLLIHWPCPMNGLFQDTWRALQELYRKGELRAIGVSNFKVHHLEALRELGGEQPMINQIEMHPFFIDYEMLSYAAKNGMTIEAWSPLLRYGDVVQNETIAALGEKYGKSPAQIALRYLTQYGARVMVKASSRAHAEENAAIFDFALEKEDVALLQALNTGKRAFQDPDEYYL